MKNQHELEYDRYYIQKKENSASNLMRVQNAGNLYKLFVKL